MEWDCGTTMEQEAGSRRAALQAMWVWQQSGVVVVVGSTVSLQCRDYGECCILQRAELWSYDPGFQLATLFFEACWEIKVILLPLGLWARSHLQQRVVPPSVAVWECAISCSFRLTFLHGSYSFC